MDTLVQNILTVKKVEYRLRLDYNVLVSIDTKVHERSKAMEKGKIGAVINNPFAQLDSALITMRPELLTNIGPITLTADRAKQFFTEVIQLKLKSQKQEQLIKALTEKLREIKDKLQPVQYNLTSVRNYIAMQLIELDKE